MSKENALIAVSGLLAPNTPRVSKRKHLSTEKKLIEELYAAFQESLIGYSPNLINVFAGGAETMPNEHIILAGIKPVGGVGGAENMIVFTPYQNEPYDKDLWYMKPGAWERVSNYSLAQLIVQVNAGTNEGTLWVQTARPPFTNLTARDWTNFGRIRFNDNISKQERQPMVAIATDKDGSFASNDSIRYQFSGKVDVRLNGLSMNVWDGFGSYQLATAYFSVGSTTTPRQNGLVQINDRLRWNPSQYAALEGGEELTLFGIVSTTSNTSDDENTGGTNDVNSFYVFDYIGGTDYLSPEINTAGKRVSSMTLYDADQVAIPGAMVYQTGTRLTFNLPYDLPSATLVYRLENTNN